MFRLQCSIFHAYVAICQWLTLRCIVIPFLYLEMIFLWLLKRNSQESKHHECFVIHSAIDQRKTGLDCKNCEGPNLWQAGLVMAMTTERFIFPDLQKISQSLAKN